MTSYQNAVDYVKDQMQQGKMNSAQANVMIVQMIGVQEIKGTVPREVRKAYNDAVKAGELGHIKKEGLKPEVYHHKNARSNALEYRNKVERTKLETLKNVFA